MKLAELKIEEIICGWEESYEYALKECPNGTILDTDPNGNRYFYHPVECRRLLLHEFNKAKLEVELYLFDDQGRWFNEKK